MVSVPRVLDAVRSCLARAGGQSISTRASWLLPEGRGTSSEEAGLRAAGSQRSPSWPHPQGPGSAGAGFHIPSSGYQSHQDTRLTAADPTKYLQIRTGGGSNYGTFWEPAS